MSTRINSIHSIHDIGATQWQRLCDDSSIQGYPFLQFAFLAALEDSGCIGQQADHPSGWQILYLTDNAEAPQWLLPCYVKQHSYGEYVFDWSWAEAYQRYGLDYYPKLQWAVPFTPASGPRHLGILPEPNTLVTLLNEVCERHNLSGWHLTFPATPLMPHPQVSERISCQFHWHNRDYQSFADYLQYFTSRKRKSVNKERQRIAQQGVTLQRKCGADISADDIAFFYRCYQDTYQRRRSWPYLNRAFFEQLRKTMSQQMMLVMASLDETPVASALYFFDDQTLYGRYWGALDDIDGLHFEACYYQGIEFCIENNLQRFDPGTQGEHKISRGFEPVITRSYHYLQHPGFAQAVADFTDEERQQVLSYQQQATSLLPFRQQDDD